MKLSELLTDLIFKKMAEESFVKFDFGKVREIINKIIEKPIPKMKSTRELLGLKNGKIK